MSWMPGAPWRPIQGTGVLAALTSGANVAVATVGKGRCVLLSATGGNCMVKVGAAATATSDILIKASDPPIPVACAPGDTINAWGLGAGISLNCVEATH